MESTGRTTPPAVPQYLSTRDVSDRLNVGMQTVRNWCRAGKLGVRVGSRFRILESELPKVAAGWADVPRWK